MPTLATTVDGLKMPNPFVIRSGPPGTNLNVITRVFREGWGAVIAKTISLDSSKGIVAIHRRANISISLSLCLVRWFRDCLHPLSPAARFSETSKEKPSASHCRKIDIDINGEAYLVKEWPIDNKTIKSRRNIARQNIWPMNAHFLRGYARTSLS